MKKGFGGQISGYSGRDATQWANQLQSAWSCQVDFITRNLCTEAPRTTASAPFPALMQPSVTSAARVSQLSLKASRWPSSHYTVKQRPLKSLLLLVYFFHRGKKCTDSIKTPIICSKYSEEFSAFEFATMTKFQNGGKY